MAEVSSGQLNIHLEANAEGAASGINKLATALGTLKSNSTGMRLGTLANNLSAIAAALPRNATAGSLVGLASGLRALSNVSKPQITKTHATTIAELGKAVNAIPAGTAAKLRDISTGLKTFAGMEKSNIGTLVKHIGQLPDAVDKLNKIDLSSLSGQFDRLAASMRPLATEMEKIANGFNAMPKRLQSYINQMEKSSGVASGALAAGSASTANANTLPFFKGVGGALASGIVKARILVGAMRSVGQGLASAVRESNAYVENLNLFDVAMGEAAEGAREYAQTVQDTLGLDMSQFIRNQGIFKQILSGFGVAEERASEMSQTLTQLAFDAGSFFNLPFETAMLKFQSGIAGELEPLRRIGYALDVATLQQYAYDAGINKTVQSMTQAEKSQIRFLAIMDQSKNIMGDLARTVHTPANAMRILGQQITLLKRAFGNVLIPILMKVIPYLNAFVQILTAGIQALATLFGFELPKIDYSGVASGAEAVGEVADGFGDVADGANAAGQAVKEFKNYMLGFDEMHVIPSNATENTGGGLGSVGGGLGGIGIGDGFDFDLEGYDFFAGLKDDISDIKLEMQGMVEDIWYYVEPLGGLFLSVGGFLVGAFAADKLAGLAQGVLGFSDETRGYINDVVQAIGGIAVAWFGTKILVSQYVDENIDGVQLFIGILGTLITSIGMVAIAFKHLGLPAWLGAIIAAGTVAISFIVNIDSAQKLKNLEDRFGNISLSMGEIKELALEITKNPWRVMLEGIENKEAEVKRLRGDLEKIERELRLSYIKVGIGIEVKEDVLLATAEDYVSTALEILKTEFDQKLLTAELTFPEGSSLLEIYLDAIGSEFNTRTEEIETIGSDFRELIDSGAWGAMSDTEKSNAIQQLVRDTREIMDASVAEVNASRRLSNLGYRLGLLFGDGLSEVDWESYQKTAAESQEIMFDELGEIRFRYDQQIADIEGSTEIDPANKRAMVDELEQEYSNTFSRYVADNAGVHLDTGWESFYPELKNINMDDPYKETMAASMEGLDIGYFSEHIDTMQRASERELATALFGERPDGYTRHAANQFIDANEEVFKALDSLADQYISRGELIPQWLVDGLRKKSGLEALAGELDGLHYIMGEGFANDPQTLRALASVEGVGAEMLPAVVRGLYSKLDFIKDETTGAIVAVRDVATGEVAFMSEVLYENLSDAGIGLNEATRELVYGISDELHGDEAGGGGGRAIAWLESFLTELGIGLGLAEETAGSGARTVVDRVKEFFNPTSWFGIGTESGSALGEGGVGGILGWLFGLGEASSAATETVENNLGDWFGLGGSKGEGLITAATEFLSDPAGYLGGAASTAFANLRSVINGQGTNMESAMTGVTNSMKRPFNIFFSDLVTSMSESLAAVGKLGIGFQFEKNTTTGGYYSVPATLIPQMYASGGYPTAGELFLMNENEPEFLTTVGGRTAVVNQDQMSKGLEAAIARGMAAANNSGGDSGDLIIQIDGRTHNLGNIAELKRKNQRAGRAVVQVN